MTTPDPLTREAALASPIARFAGWHLTIHCPGCRLLRPVEIRKLMGLRGGSILLGELVSKLRCHACGAVSDWVRFADREPWTAAGPVTAVMLVQDRP